MSWADFLPYVWEGAKLGAQYGAAEMSSRDRKKWEKKQRAAERRANLINVASGGRTNVRPEYTEFQPGKGARLFGGLSQAAGIADTAMQIRDATKLRRSQLDTQKLQRENLNQNIALGEQSFTENQLDAAKRQGALQGGSTVSDIQAQVQNHPLYQPGGDNSPIYAQLLGDTDRSVEDLVPEGYGSGQRLAYAGGYTGAIDTAATEQRGLAEDYKTRSAADAARTRERLIRERDQRNIDRRADAQLDLQREEAKFERKRTIYEDAYEQTQAYQKHMANGIYAKQLRNGEITIDSLPTPEMKADVLAIVAAQNPNLVPSALRRDMSGKELENFKNDSMILASLAGMEANIKSAVEMDEESGWGDRDVFSWSVGLGELFNWDPAGPPTKDAEGKIVPTGPAATLRAKLKGDIESVKAILSKAQGNSGVLSDPDIERVTTQLPDMNTMRDPYIQYTRLQNVLNDVRSKYEQGYIQMRSAGIAIPTSGHAELDLQMETKFQELDARARELSGGQIPRPGATGRGEVRNQGLQTRIRFGDDRQKVPLLDEATTTDSITARGAERRGGPFGGSMVDETTRRMTSQPTVSAPTQDIHKAFYDSIVSNTPGGETGFSTTVQDTLENYLNEELEKTDDQRLALRRAASRWYSDDADEFQNITLQGRSNNKPSIADYSLNIANNTLDMLGQSGIWSANAGRNPPLLLQRNRLNRNRNRLPISGLR